jgi:hypothetical protein
MSKKIAKVDAEAMNSLYGSELTKVGVKLATDKEGPKDPQAFEDHADYIKTVESVLKESENVGGSKDPNDKIAD